MGPLRPTKKSVSGERSYARKRNSRNEEIALGSAPVTLCLLPPAPDPPFPARAGTPPRVGGVWSQPPRAARVKTALEIAMQVSAGLAAVHKQKLVHRDINQGIPQPVVILVEVLLEKDPGRRFQTLAELLKAMPRITGAIEAGRALTHQSLGQMPAGDSYAVTRKPAPTLGPEKISIARLPVTGSDIFGREEDIAFLDDAWGKPEFKCRYHSCQGWCWEVHARQPLASRDGR